MILKELLWRSHVRVPNFNIGDEVIYMHDPIGARTRRITDVKPWSTEEDSGVDVKVGNYPYWQPAEFWVRVRRA